MMNEEYEWALSPGSALFGNDVLEGEKSIGQELFLAPEGQISVRSKFPYLSTPL